MADSTTYIQPLNGLEIINDLCGAIGEKLEKDCNLREIDGYSSGYKAKITIHLECYGLDMAEVNAEVVVDMVAPDAENPLQEPDTLIDTELEVAQEEDLSAVRERSNQAEPSIEITPDGPTQPQKRKYSRRLKALGMDGTSAVAQGAATGTVDE